MRELSRRLGRRLPAASVRICARLESMAEVTAAPLIAAYAALPDEVDLTPLIGCWLDSGKTVLLPRFDEALERYCMVPISDASADLAPAKFGVLEPLQTLRAAAADVVGGPSVTWLVPGVAFDRSGNRLGRGRGYYDRLLERTGGCRLGVAADWQVVDRLPIGARDVPMHAVVTDKRFLRTPHAEHRTLNTEH